jgi:aspartokinase
MKQMINISKVVRDILARDDIAIEAMKRDIMNFSSYAREIKERVEELAMKKVDIKSVVVALSRISKDYSKENTKQDIKILNLSVHSDIAEVVYPRIKENLTITKQIYTNIPNDMESFFAISQGISEITFIGQKKMIKKISSRFNKEPKYNYENLTGISARFPVEYLEIPNIIYEISKLLALKNINLIEVVSTTTEITYIIDKKDTQKAVAQLSELL